MDLYAALEDNHTVMKLYLANTGVKGHLKDLVGMLLKNVSIIMLDISTYP